MTCLNFNPGEIRGLVWKVKLPPGKVDVQFKE
jgi:hypothetical protein